MTYQYFTVEMVNNAKTNGGYIDQKMFKTAGKYGFDSLFLTDTSMQVLEGFINHVRPLLKPTCDYVFVTRNGRQHSKLGESMSKLVFDAAGKYDHPTHYRQMVETVFWPGISEDVRNVVEACDICQKHKPAQQKEPLIPHDVPSMPWIKLGIDIFEHRSHHYLLVADYFSKFPIVRKLSNHTSGHVIGLLKTIFAEYGIPAVVYTDQGT